MQTTRLGRTGLEVSRLCLGSMQFGWTADRDTSFEVLDAFVDAGGSLIDTADVYSRWVEGNEGGVSERIIGTWMRVRGRRQDVVLATKVRGRMWDGPNGEGLSRAHVLRAVEDSLRRLETDHIDLYQAHWLDEDCPIEETLRAFDDLVSSGKVRYIGCSNYPAWRVMESLWASGREHRVRYDAVQPHYNLVHRAEYERELEGLCRQEGLGVIPYSPLAGGFLTGKYRADERLPDSARAERIEERYMNERNMALLETMDTICQAHEAEPAQVALAWLLARPTITAPIIGANSTAQLESLLPALELQLAPEEVETLDRASDWRQSS